MVDGVIWCQVSGWLMVLYGARSQGVDGVNWCQVSGG